jgi:hypothetical protein
MSNMFFEPFAQAGFIRNDAVDVDRIANASLSNLVEMIRRSEEAVVGKSREREISTFAHCASMTLSGGRFPCDKLSCREQRADEVTQFASLYSERVYLNNILSESIAHIDEGTVDEGVFRRRFVDDLSIMLRMRAPIEAERIIPFTAPSSFCPNCITTETYGPDAVKRFERQERWLTREFQNRVSVDISYERGYYLLRFKGPEELLDHGNMVIGYSKLPDAIQRRPEIVRRVQNGETVRLSEKARRNTGVYETFSRGITVNVLFELAAAQSFGTSYLTEKPLEIKFLQGLSDDVELEKRNRIALQHLSSIVPFVRDLDPYSLLELRKREEEAFVVFRSALSQVVDEFRASRSDFTEKHARQLYSEALAPKLAKLDQKITEGKKGLVSSALLKPAAWVGSITFGQYLGFTPDGLRAAAASLGLARPMAEYLEKLLPQLNPEAAIRNDEMYFLWKVRQASRVK